MPSKGPTMMPDEIVVTNSMVQFPSTFIHKQTESRLMQVGSQGNGRLMAAVELRLTSIETLQKECDTVRHLQAVASQQELSKDNTKGLRN